MQTANTTGMKPRTTDDVSNTNNRCHCGREADGVDARSRQPTCRDCAGQPTALADGGVRWFDLSGFQLNLLREIVETEKPSGQTIRRNLEARTGDEINHGRLYPNLDELVDHQLVEKGEQDQRTNYYEVTNAGRTLAEQIADDFDYATTEPLAAATDGGSTDE